MTGSAANPTDAQSPIPSNTSTLRGLPNDRVHRYYCHLALLRSIRIGLSVLTLAATIAILGTSGSALNTYERTYLSEEWLLPLWPIEFDIRPTKGLLGSAAVIAFFSLLVIGVSVMPMVSYSSKVAISREYSS